MSAKLKVLIPVAPVPPHPPSVLNKIKNYKYMTIFKNKIFFLGSVFVYLLNF